MAAVPLFGQPPILPSPPAFRTPFEPPYLPDQIIVKFKAGVSAQAIEALHKAEGTAELYTSPFAGFKLLKIPLGRTVPQMVEAFQRNPLIEYAQPNSICYAFWGPNDLYYNLQWHFPKINMPTAWDYFIPCGAPGPSPTPVGVGSGVVVAVLDSGVAYEDYIESPSHKYYKAPDLANTTFVAGYDFVNNDTHPNDDNSHGTHVTGTIAQSTNNGLGAAGIAFNASIMPVKVLDSSGSGTAANLADGLYYAADHGAKVINMSMGWPVYSFGPYDPGLVVHDAITYAYNKGVTLVAAAGNDNLGYVAYPAAYPEVIAVGATQYDDNRAPYSNYGDALAVVAPGGNLSVDQNGDGYGDGVLQQTFNPSTKKTDDFGYWFLDGTSMATPHVSALAALLIAKGLTGPGNVRSVIQNTAQDLGTAGWDSTYGYGRINAFAALASPSLPVSITVSDGAVAFGNVALSTSVDNTSDIQTITVELGPANLGVKTTLFTAGASNWTLGTTNGSDQVVWEYSADGTTWTTFTTTDTLYPLASSVARCGTKTLYLRLTMPTSTTSSEQHTANITVVATMPP